MGYALALHGSMVNDLDIVAIPWVEEAAAPEELVAAIKAGMVGFTDWDTGKDRDKPHGRQGYLIWFSGLNHVPGGKACIDLSIMPRTKEAPKVDGPHLSKEAMALKIKAMRETLAYISEHEGDTAIGAMAESHLIR